MKDWVYNESEHVGVDYAQKEIANIYDEQMENFRDYDLETKALVESFSLADPKSLTAVDLGCGTGAFAVHAARYFKKIYAVDISKEMLKISSHKASAVGIDNILFVNSGFLQYQPDIPVDLVFTKWAFHHLPDYWKQVAFLNINRMIKKDGLFYLADVVFKFDPEYEKSIEALLANVSNQHDVDFVKETKIHIREEYSTYDWILEGMLERAGFSIERANKNDMLLTEYLCRKVAAV